MNQRNLCRNVHVKALFSVIELKKGLLPFQSKLAVNPVSDFYFNVTSGLMRMRDTMTLQTWVSLCASVPVLSCWNVVYVHRNRRLIRDWSPGRPPFFSHSSWALQFVSKSTWCLTSTETIRLIRVWGEGGMEVGEEGYYIPIATLSPPEWLLHYNWQRWEPF